MFGTNMESSGMEETYHLATELIGHEEDVRAVTVLEGAVITGSRDKTIKIWTEQSGNLVATENLVGHTSFVSSIAAFAPGTLQQFPQRGIVSGSRDLSTIIWNLESHSPAYKLTGHKFQVSCVAVSKQNEIISASHDGTIRVHSGPAFDSVEVLDKHQGPVQTLLVLPDGRFLSGGNDNNILLWSGTKCQCVFKGHTDTVRDLALLEGLGVVSASHDMTLKVWDFNGKVQAELVGHTAIIYSVATSSQGLIASASEDNSARIWRPDGQCLAHIPHPGCVWDVAFRENGDLVTGCSDFVARIFSTDPSRKAEEAVQEAYRAAAAPRPQEAGSSMDSQLPPGLKVEDISQLQLPGTKDGQIKVIRESGGGMAYSWNSAQSAWEKVGQVCGAESGGDMQMGTSSLNGKQYDHVIDVDIADGAPPLKMGFNRDDNPYNVADRFIEEHSLPVDYREQIAEYIVRNTGLKMPVDTSFNPDPFTGGGAYVPGQASSLRPQPERQWGSDSVTGGGADPFTGSSRSRGTSPSASFPATSMLIFDRAINVAAVGKKVLQLSDELANAADTRSMAVSQEESEPGGSLDRLLSCSETSQLGNDELHLLEKLLRWPATSLFPVLDITRFLILNQQAAGNLATAAGPLELSPLGNLGSALACACAEPQMPANLQLGLRLLCNAFKNTALRQWLKQQAGPILDGFATSFCAPQKALRGAASAFLLNLAILSRGEPLDTVVDAQALSALTHMLENISQDDEEALQRGLLALGTFMHGDEGREARKLVLEMGCRSTLQKLTSSKSQAVAARAKEALLMLQS